MMMTIRRVPLWLDRGQALAAYHDQQNAGDDGSATGRGWRDACPSTRT